MNRRTLIGAVAASAALPVLDRVASAQTSLKTKNVVFVHGLFADGSCWSKVIALDPYSRGLSRAWRSPTKKFSWHEHPRRIIPSNNDGSP